MFNRLVALFAVWLLVTSAIVLPAQAKKTPLPKPIVDVSIDISSQSMLVWVYGWPYGRWKVSTARDGYYTPRGKYRVQRTARVYYSKKYDDAPMPNSVFFKGGYAIHGTAQVKVLGRPVSHGCVRLHPKNAAALFSLVRRAGCP